MDLDPHSESEVEEEGDDYEYSGSGSEDSSDMDGAAVAAFFSRRPEGQDGEAYADEEQDSLPDPQKQKDSRVFNADRVNPILTAAARFAEIEFVPDEEPESKLMFGNSGLRRKRPSPILFMPPDVYTAQKEAREYKGKIGSTPSLMGIFKVPQEDYDALFAVPKLGPDVEAFVQSSTVVPDGYVKRWEETLCSLDGMTRGLTRLAAFQLLIANALGVQLSDAQDAAEPDSPSAMASLSADIASRQVAMLMRFSEHTCRLRRENVFASIHGQHKKKLETKLKELDLGGGNLFGGKGFLKSLSKVAKHIDGQRKVSSTVGSLGRPRSRPPTKVTRGMRKQKRAQRSHPYAGAGFRDEASTSFQPGRSGFRGRAPAAPKRPGSYRGGQQQSRGRGRRGRGKRF